MLAAASAKQDDKSIKQTDEKGLPQNEVKFSEERAKRAAVRYFNLDKQLNDIKTDAKLTEIDLSNYRQLCDEKNQLKTNTYSLYAGPFVGLSDDGQLANVQLEGAPPRYSLGIFDFNKKSFAEKHRFSSGSRVDDVPSLLLTLPAAQIAGVVGNTIKIFDLTSGEVMHTLAGHDDKVVSLTALPSGLLASGSNDKTIKLWELERGTCVKTFITQGHVQCLTALQGDRLASHSAHFQSAYSREDYLTIWAADQEKCLAILPIKFSIFTALKDGRLAVRVPDTIAGHHIEIWDINKVKCVMTLQEQDRHLYAPFMLELPNGDLLLAQSRGVGIRIKLFDLKNGSCMAFSEENPFAYDKTGMVLPNGCVVIAGRNDLGRHTPLTLKVIDPAGQPLQLKNIQPLLAALPNSSVQHLNLQNTALDDINVPMLLRLLRNSPLAYLDIRNTSITKNGLRELYKGFKECQLNITIQHEAMVEILAENSQKSGVHHHHTLTLNFSISPNLLLLLFSVSVAALFYSLFIADTNFKTKASLFVTTGTLGALLFKQGFWRNGDNDQKEAPVRVASFSMQSAPPRLNP